MATRGRKRKINDDNVDETTQNNEILDDFVDDVKNISVEEISTVIEEENAVKNEMNGVITVDDINDDAGITIDDVNDDAGITVVDVNGDEWKGNGISVEIDNDLLSTENSVVEVEASTEIDNSVITETIVETLAEEDTVVEVKKEKDTQNNIETPKKKNKTRNTTRDVFGSDIFGMIYDY